MSGELAQTNRELSFEERFAHTEAVTASPWREFLLAEARELEDQFSTMEVITKVTSPPPMGVLGAIRGTVIATREDNSGSLQPNKIILTIEDLYECGTIEMRHNAGKTIFPVSWVSKRTSDELWLEYYKPVAWELKRLRHKKERKSVL